MHHIHAWTLTSGKNLFMAHIMIEPNKDHEIILDDAYRLLQSRFGFYFSTVQVEKSCRALQQAKSIDYLAETNPAST